MMAAAALNDKSDNPEDTVAKLVQEVVSLKLVINTLLLLLLIFLLLFRK